MAQSAVDMLDETLSWLPPCVDWLVVTSQLRHGGRTSPAGTCRGTPPRHLLIRLEMATVEYIDWYNNRRLHGELDHVPPAEYELLHAMTQPVTETLKTS